MRIGTRITASYVAMTLIGIFLAILPAVYLNLRLDLTDLLTSNVATVVFMAGDVLSILGLHEVCHCLYCEIKDIEITGALVGLRGLGIKVKKDYRQEVRLSSLFCIPITIMASALLLPLWVLLLNTGFACVSCIDDIARFVFESPWSNSLRARQRSSSVSQKARIFEFLGFPCLSCRRILILKRES